MTDRAKLVCTRAIRGLADGVAAPLVIGGMLKAVYDLAFLVQFRAVRTREAGVG